MRVKAGLLHVNKNKAAKIDYNNQWTNERFDRINIAVHKGEKQKYQQAAQAAGKSLNAWIVDAMESKAVQNSK